MAVIVGITDGAHPNHSRADEIDDLSKIFHILDGRPEADHETCL
jgi:hypothetical protein